MHVDRYDSSPNPLVLRLAALLLSVACAAPAFAQIPDYPTAPDATVAAQPQTGTCDLGNAKAYLDANNVRALIPNTGGLFYVDRGSENEYEVPKGSGKNSIFIAGTWIGGMVDGDLRTSAAVYSDWEMWPGPLDDDGNPPESCSAFDRIWKITKADVDAIDDGTISNDIAEWPWKLGAPVVDGDGDPDNYNLGAGDRPELLGDQTLWWIMNDAGNEHRVTATPPIGLEMHVTAYSFASDVDAINNTTFYRYTLIYKGGKPWEDAWFGLLVDGDLGDPSDDFMGSDSLRHMGYFYNGDNLDERSSGYGENPPALGVQMLSGPAIPPDGEDNDFDGEIDEDGERLGMSRFVYFNSDGTAQGNPIGAQDRYYYLQGRWRDGRGITQGGSGRGFSQTAARFMYPGDPVQKAFWSEENIDGAGTRNQPADRHLLLTTGPFRMEPGDVQEIDLAIVWSQGTNRLYSVSQLRRDADVVKAFYEGRPLPTFDTPATLEAPQAVSPPDAAITVDPLVDLTWVPSTDTLIQVIEIATDPAFNDVVENRLVFDGLSSFTTTLGSNTTYYWHVRTDAVGAASEWSPARSFTVRRSNVPADDYASFEVAQNQAGPLVPPEPAALASQGFPTPGGASPTERQQTAAGRWLIHTGDDGSRRTYDAFFSRVTNGDIQYRLIVPFDFEIRFTEEGSLAYDPFCTGKTFDVPFELWRTGIATPDDPSDDVRMVPYVLDNDFTSLTGFNGLPAFNLNSDASIQAAVDDPDIGTACATDVADHSASSATDDPQTDWIYWATPTDDSPGEAGYLAWKRAAQAGGDDFGYGTLVTDNAMRRMVLVNWNGGDVETGAYNQDLPETGTIFRISTTKAPERDLVASLSSLNSSVPRSNGQASGEIRVHQHRTQLAFEGFVEGLAGDHPTVALYSASADTAFAELKARNEGTRLVIDAENNVIPAFRYDAFYAKFLNYSGIRVVVRTDAYPEGEIAGILHLAPDTPPEPANITSPVAGAEVVVSDDTRGSFAVAWQTAAEPNGQPVTYFWQLASDRAFRDVLITERASDQTTLRPSYDALDDALDRAGIPVGETATLYHRVVTTDGSLITPAAPRSLRFVRGVVTGTDDDTGLPERFTLQGNYPNPFSRTTTLVYDLPEAAEVSVAVFDVLGRRVTLQPARREAPGFGRRLTLDGSRLASGVYFYRIIAKAAKRTWQEAGSVMVVR